MTCADVTVGPLVRLFFCRLIFRAFSLRASSLLHSLKPTASSSPGLRTEPSKSGTLHQVCMFVFGYRVRDFRAKKGKNLGYRQALKRAPTVMHLDHSQV